MTNATRKSLDVSFNLIKNSDLPQQISDIVENFDMRTTLSVIDKVRSKNNKDILVGLSAVCCLVVQILLAENKIILKDTENKDK